MKTQREELDEARMDNYPPCKNCNHPGESHDEEFGTCDFSGLTQTGWQICDCPGYEEGEDWEIAFANYPIAS